jgi:hypothetical protein
MKVAGYCPDTSAARRTGGFENDEDIRPVQQDSKGRAPEFFGPFSISVVCVEV